MKTIIYTHAAAKDLDAIPAGDRIAIEQAIDMFAQNGRGDVKALGGRNAHRLRVGRYRVIFAAEANNILIVYVGKRETTIYRRP